MTKFTTLADLRVIRKVCSSFLTDLLNFVINFDCMLQASDAQQIFSVLILMKTNKNSQFSHVIIKVDGSLVYDKLSNLSASPRIQLIWLITTEKVWVIAKTWKSEKSDDSAANNLIHRNWQSVFCVWIFKRSGKLILNLSQKLTTLLGLIFVFLPNSSDEKTHKYFPVIKRVFWSSSKVILWHSAFRKKK